MCNNIVIVLTLIGAACAAAAALHNENGEKQQQQQQKQTIWRQLPMYPSMQSNYHSTSGYNYPQYMNIGGNAYKAQPGYENHLPPMVSTMQKSPQWSLASIAYNLLSLSSKLILYGARTSTIMLQYLLLTLVGTVFTTIVCMYTSICEISFPGFAVSRNQVKEQVTELARAYMTPEYLDIATTIVNKAIDNFTQYQNNSTEQNTLGATLNNAKNTNSK